MADLNIVRKQGPTLWPWLIGLVVLGLLIWGIAELVNTDRDNQTMEEADADGSVATAVAPGAAAPPPAAQPDLTPAPLAALEPLGTQDVGQQVSATGQVLTSAADGGFWLRTENRAVIWVRSPQRVKPGEQVQEMTGTLQQARGDSPATAPDADVVKAAGKGVAFVQGLYLDASPAPAPSTAASTRGRSPADRPAKSKPRRRPAAKRADVAG